MKKREPEQGQVVFTADTHGAAKTPIGTRITLENENGVYTIQVRDTGMTGPDLVDFLVEPVLLAAGYHPDTVADALGRSTPSEGENPNG